MKILAICRPTAGADRSAFGAHVPAEIEAMRKLAADGTLIEAYTIDGPGAVLFLEAQDLDAARRATDELPMTVAGLIQAELIAVYPVPAG